LSINVKCGKKYILERTTVLILFWKEVFMEVYKKVEVVSYVKEGIENGTLIPVQAEKFARIIARQGNVGETVISWSVDQDGKEVQEKVNKVELDKETNEPGWVVTKVDEQGMIIVDNNNHTNEWIIEDHTFKDKYELDPANPSLFKPKGGIQIFVQIPDNIILNQWGSDMKIAAGGYINITKVDDMYGISQRDFEDTYKVLNDKSKKM